MRLAPLRAVIYGALLLAAARGAAACGAEAARVEAPAGEGGAGGAEAAGGAGGAGGEPVFPGLTPCSIEEPCEQGKVCTYEDNECGLGLNGRCASLPAACPEASPAICGCDGQIYESWCAAREAGIDVANASACELPAGTYACGAAFCLAGEEACSHWIAPGEWFSCEPLPASCMGMAPPVDCSCFEDLDCGCDVIEGQLWLTCGTE